MNVKRKLIIILFMLIVILSFVYVFYSINKINNRSKNDEIQNVERDNYVEKFAKQGKIQEFKGSEDESGYNGILILNKDKLVKITTLDEFTGILSGLNYSLNSIRDITKDKNILMPDYFDKNKTFINENFGINTQSEFKKFIKYIGYNENQEFEIKKCLIENVTRKDNNISIDLLINDSKVKVEVNITNNDKSNNVKYDIHYNIPAD